MVQRHDQRWMPTLGSLVLIGLLAVLARVGVVVGVMWIDGVTISEYAAYRDGNHYMAYALAWLGDFEQFEPHHRRLFPGYPALMAILHTLGAPLALAGVVPNWLLGAAVAVGSALFFRDRRVGYAMAVLTPTYLLNASMISTETVCLVLTLAGLWLALAQRSLPGGVAFGLAGLFRPMACFAVLGYAAVALKRRQWKQMLMTGGIALAIVLLGLMVVQWRFDDALMSARVYATDQKAYGGQLLAWPFESLIMTPLRHPTAVWKMAYIWAHVVVVLVGCGLALWRWRSAPGALGRPAALAAAVWLWTNTAFVLCVGDIWGFHEFDRFIIPALPPLMWAYAAILPRQWWVWPIIGVLSVSIALPGAARGSLLRRAEPPTAVVPVETHAPPGLVAGAGLSLPHDDAHRHGGRC